MESNRDDLTALEEAERARDALAADIRIPPGQDLAIGAAVAVQVLTSVVGLTVDDPWARTVLVVGNVVFGLVAVVQIVRFRRLNGVKLQGFVSRVILGSAMTASFGYGVSLVAAYVAALRDLWWLAALAALAGGVVYVLSGRRWLRAYRREPERLGRAESALWMAVLVGLAAAGAVLLVTQA